MGAHSRAKGKRGEREVVALARVAGLDAERTWHTAQSPDAGERACDLLVAGMPYQVQVSKDGFERIYRELQGVRGFIFRRDRDGWLVTVRLDDYLALLRGAK